MQRVKPEYNRYIDDIAKLKEVEKSENDLRSKKLWQYTTDHIQVLPTHTCSPDEENFLFTYPMQFVTLIRTATTNKVLTYYDFSKKREVLLHTGHALVEDKEATLLDLCMLNSAEAIHSALKLPQDAGSIMRSTSFMPMGVFTHNSWVFVYSNIIVPDSFVGDPRVPIRCSKAGYRDIECCSPSKMEEHIQDTLVIVKGDS